MSIEWTTGTSANLEIVDEDFSDDYGSTVDEGNVGLMIGSGEDGVLVEGTHAEILFMLRAATLLVEEHERTTAGVTSADQAVRLAMNPPCQSTSRAKLITESKDLTPEGATPETIALQAAAYDGYRPRCRWRNCTEDAETRGFCDPHFDTL